MVFFFFFFFVYVISNSVSMYVLSLPRLFLYFFFFDTLNPFLGCLIDITPLVPVLSRQYMVHGPGSKKGKDRKSLEEKKTDLHII
ncbi:hypothetical protein VN97_g1284 [Penicillium thymicola]|uniref:Uncharacterized protein n=1 Tax=Penicillium thymicola TaxID=293382 RepID=A0AAI9TR72_PENTH|nr:hypothetical protein VN97_g1284 [Penicillium thymicola]